MRFPESLHAAIRAEVARYAERELETFLFLLLTRVETPLRRLFLARSVVVLDEDEVIREGLRTYPTEAFCRQFYGTLKGAGVFLDGVRIGAVHSHPFARGPVAFSGTDLASFEADSGIFGREFGGVEFLGVVFNRDCSAFDGLVIGAEGLSPIDAAQIVGTSFLHMARSRKGGAG